MFKKQINSCLVCKKKITKILNLRNLPEINNLKKKKKIKYKQGFSYCEKCMHGQLSLFIKNKKKSDYVFRSSKSINVSNNTLKFLKILNPFIKEKKNCLEVGSNDGHLLDILKKRINKVYGADAIYKKDFVKKNITFVKNDIENENLFKKLKNKFDLIICRHTIEHFEKPEEAMNNIIKCSKKNTIFAFEFPSLEHIINRGKFDYIFNEHKNYFSLNSFLILIKKFNPKILEIKYDYMSWGSIIIIFKIFNKNKIKLSNKKFISKKMILENYKEFCSFNKNLNKTLKKMKNNFYCYGVSELNLIQNYHLGNVFKYSKNFIDDNVKKIGKKIPEFDKKIIKFSSIKSINNQNFVITAPHSYDLIINKLIKHSPKSIISINKYL